MPSRLREPLQVLPVSYNKFADLSIIHPARLLWCLFEPIYRRAGTISTSYPHSRNITSPCFPSDGVACPIVPESTPTENSCFGLASFYFIFGPGRLALAKEIVNGKKAFLSIGKQHP